MNAAPAPLENIHRLDLGAAGCAAVKLTFHAAEITAVVDVPPRLNRRHRRHVQRWTREIFRELDPDRRGLRLVVTSKGRVVSIGAELGGRGIVIYA